MEITVFVSPGFNLSATFGFLDTFTAVNDVEGATIYSHHFVSDEGGPVASHQGPSVDTVHVDEVKSASDMVVISTSADPQAAYGLPLSKHLRYWRRRDALMIGLETGAFVLAEGYFLKSPACIHPMFARDFMKEHPSVGLSGKLFDAEGDTRTCAGATAVVDMTLSIIAERHTGDLVRTVRDFLIAPEPRNGDLPIAGGAAVPLAEGLPEPLMATITHMKSALDQSLSVPALAGEAGLSQRQLERLFKAHTGRSPNQYYRMLRLDRARDMVVRGSTSIPEIAKACGFVSSVHFSRAYKEQFGRPPMRDRVKSRPG
ncbi:MAG: helix-turn-helix domain-containing protein [Rhodobacteraceae bacterium]|nr:helix-turn-helix domain-containing protein [Paracoccaceae bacterium]